MLKADFLDGSSNDVATAITSDTGEEFTFSEVLYFKTDTFNFSVVILHQDNSDVTARGKRDPIDRKYEIETLVKRQRESIFSNFDSKNTIKNQLNL